MARSARKVSGWLFLWMFLIFVTSCFHVSFKQFLDALRHAGSPRFQSGFTRFWKSYWWVFVKGWHATEFAVLFTLCARSLQTAGLRFTAAVRWSLLAAALYAATDEWHQTFVPGRGGRATDVLIDTGGAVMAALLLWGRSFARSQRPDAATPDGGRV